MAPAKHSHLIPRFWMHSILSVSLCVGAAVWVQAQTAQQGSTDESWTASRNTTVANTNPSRTIESHSKSGNRTVDKQTLEVLGPDGRYVPSSETETETVQVDAVTTRTVVRTYAWDGNGGKQLAQETEEESRTTANGDSHVVRSTSDADGYGSLQVVQREVVDTSKTNPNVEETKSTVSRPDSYGGFTQVQQTQQVKTRTADDTFQSKTTTLVPDGNGNWEMLQTKEKNIKDDGKIRTTEERTEGRLSESSRTVSKETETGSGEKRKTVETYSNYIPGSGYGDSGMNLNQRITTIQKKDPGGETIEGQVEEGNGVNPSDSPKVTAKTKYVVTYGYAGTQQTKSVEVRDGGGNFYVFETQKSERTTPGQKPPTSPNKPR
jgi:hypothetical protein